MMEGVISCPGCVNEDDDGLHGVAETEGAWAQWEEELAMAQNTPDGCQECVCEISPQEGGEVDGDIVNAHGGPVDTGA